MFLTLVNRHVDETARAIRLKLPVLPAVNREEPPELLRGPSITGEIKCDVCIPLANLPVDSFGARVPEASAWKSNYFPLSSVASSTLWLPRSKSGGLAYICARADTKLKRCLFQARGRRSICSSEATLKRHVRIVRRLRIRG